MSTRPPDDVIDLSIGEPRYAAPAESLVAASRAMLAGQVGYLPEAGLPSLRAALARKLRDSNGIDASEHEIVVTTGASLGAFAVTATVCEPGERVLLPDPGFPLYAMAAERLGLEVLRYGLGHAPFYEPDWDTLERHAHAARLLIWNFPSNPLGVVARTDWVERLGAILVANPRLHVLSDEVYESLTLDGPHVGAAANIPQNVRNRCLSVFSFSKTFALSGWRVGYVHAPDPWAHAVARAQWTAAMSAPTAGQWAALAALTAAPAYLNGVRELLTENRSLALSSVHAMGLACARPEAGFFLWIDLRDHMPKGQDLVAACELECGVRLSAGSIFGPIGAAHVRLSYAVPTASLRHALERLGAWMPRSTPFRQTTAAR